MIYEVNTDANTSLPLSLSASPFLVFNENNVDRKRHDYAVDEQYRNDNGGIYVVNLDADTLTLLSLFVYPTEIEAFQAKRAEGEDYEWIVRTMTKLCRRYLSHLLLSPHDHLDKHAEDGC